MPHTLPLGEKYFHGLKLNGSICQTARNTITTNAPRASKTSVSPKVKAKLTLLAQNAEPILLKKHSFEGYGEYNPYKA